MALLDQIIAANRFEFEKTQAKAGIQIQKEFENTTNLNSLKGIGPKTIQNLATAWITTIEQLKQLSEEEVTKLCNSPLTIKSILKSLREYN